MVQVLKVDTELAGDMVAVKGSMVTAEDMTAVVLALQVVAGEAAAVMVVLELAEDMAMQVVVALEVADTIPTRDDLKF